MKSIKQKYLCVIAFFTFGLVSAQLGARAGVNISSVSKGNLEDKSGKTGSYFGVFKEFNLFAKRVYLVPEVQFSNQGFKANASSVNLNYITVPILAKLYVLKIISFETGPQFGFNVKRNVSGILENAHYNDFDPAWDFGVGLRLPLKFSLHARYVTSFNEVITNSNAKNHVLQLGIAFNF